MSMGHTDKALAMTGKNGAVCIHRRNSRGVDHRQVRLTREVT